MRLRGAVLLSLMIASTGCATARGRTAAPVTLPAGAGVISVPFHAQEDHQCGPAAIAMTLGWSGVSVAPADLADEVYTSGRKGSLQPDLIAAARRHDRIAYVIGGRDELLAELAAGNPVIVLQNLGLSWLPRWHYAVVLGHDPATETFVLHSGRHAYRAVGESTFAHTWKRADDWGLLALPPNRIPATADEMRWLAAVVGAEQSGRTETAAAAYRAAVARWPESLGARIGLANAQYAAGDLDGAEQSLRAAIVAHPNAAVAWNNLAHLLGERGRKAAALTAARRAVEIGGPDVALFEQTLAELERR
jgi:tetratricopeptide (TPR) repeat protein